MLNFATENKILSKTQLGFLPGNRTSDALLILHNLVDYYCNKNKKYLYGCFVDFSKAFDSIPRHILFTKLLKHNISGKFYDCLVNMYTEDQSCIKIKNKTTNNFTINQGVKQGCVLSPLLFNIFMSDLPDELEKQENDPIEISPNEFCSGLLWADDLLMLSQSEKGLQNMLNTLHEFSKKNGLNVNLEKTNVMIFNKTGRHIRRNFYLGTTKVETTREYKYLGFKVTPSGEINSGLKDLKDRALRAFMKLKLKMGPFFRKYQEITIKLFNTLITPILLYASDFWGLLKLPTNCPFETLFQSFCKQLLGVQKQTTNTGVLLELGLVPLSLYAKKNAFKNWHRISEIRVANPLVRLSYEYALDQKLSWPMRSKSILAEIGMMNIFLSKTETINCHINIFQRLRDIFHQNAFAEINRPNSKLRTYKHLKTDIGTEKYLHLISCPENRVAMSKFRLSNHNLMIEKGRHNQIRKDQRFCPICPKDVEDEKHFLLHCEGYIDERKYLFLKVNQLSRGFKHFNDAQKFIFLLTNHDALRITAKFISQNFVRRELLLTELSKTPAHAM